MIFKSKKKGESATSFLQAAGIGVGILVITIAVMAQVLGQVRSTQTAGTTEYNVTGNGLTAMASFGDWFLVIVVVIVAVAILGLIKFLGGRND